MKKIPKYLAGYTGDCCALCGRNGSGDPLDTHHIFNGGARRQSEVFGLTVRLCHGRCHQIGANSVHRNQDVDLKLKQYGERLAMEQYGWTVEDFRAMFGKNYLDEGMEELDPEEMIGELRQELKERNRELQDPAETQGAGTLQRMDDFAAELARKRRERLRDVPSGCFEQMP